MPIKDLLSKWPAFRQLQNLSDGTGDDAMTDRTRGLRARTHEPGVKAARSICPYCGVGCGQLAFHKDGKLISIEGDPQSPISRGHLCPKGANSFELVSHAGRETTVKYRRPYSDKWEDLSLETAMDMVAQRVWATRESSFVEEQDGQSVMHTKNIAHLGGATLDNEENYLIKKLFAGGLGMVCISNQARI